MISVVSHGFWLLVQSSAITLTRTAVQSRCAHVSTVLVTGEHDQAHMLCFLFPRKANFLFDSAVAI